MSTTNTDYSWYYYLRNKGKRLWLGLMNEDGDAPTSALEIKIYADKLSTEITDDDSILPLPSQCELAFAKGIAAEIMCMSETSPKDILALYKKEYEDMKRDLLHRNINESQQPMVIKPFDLRDDG